MLMNMKMVTIFTWRKNKILPAVKKWIYSRKLKICPNEQPFDYHPCMSWKKEIALLTLDIKTIQMVKFKYINKYKSETSFRDKESILLASLIVIYFKLLSSTHMLCLFIEVNIRSLSLERIALSIRNLFNCCFILIHINNRHH